jgi:hypothetical protein
MKEGRNGAHSNAARGHSIRKIVHPERNSTQTCTSNVAIVESDVYFCSLITAMFERFFKSGSE